MNHWKVKHLNQNGKSHVVKLLDLPQIEKSLVGLDECEMRERNELCWGV